MAAGARQRRPQQNGVDPLPRRERRGLELGAGGVQHRPFAAELAIPDGKLAAEIAKAADGHEVDSRLSGRAAQIQKRRHDLGVQQTRGIGNGGNMRARLARELSLIHEATPRVAANSATWSNTRAKMPTSWAPEIVY